jgi:hypothetical protein
MTSRISVRSHDVPLDHTRPGSGLIMTSEVGRPTETSARVKKSHPANYVRCSKGEWLPPSAFSPDPRKRNGLQSICKAHRALHMREVRAGRCDGVSSANLDNGGAE